ncbi:DUF5009 domain-containing protein [Bacteroidota bacterium]
MRFRVLNKPASDRVESIDVFRGLTILAMIFVNDLASITGIPGWMKHMPTEVDGMTFVDLVFPAFLFIVGVAIPFAIDKRLRRGDSYLQIWKHILIRTTGLIILGILMVNIGNLNEEYTGMDKNLWVVLLFVSVILVWNQYSHERGKIRFIFYLLRSIGICVLVYLAAIYRGGTESELTWFKTSWWGILGLIGWAYLISCTLYFIFRNHHAAMVGMVAFLILLFVGDTEGILNFLQPVSDVVWIGGHIGTHSAITVSGIVVSMLFFGENKNLSPLKRILWILIFALFIYLTGCFLRPHYIVSKNLATPSWGLFSISICSVIFAFLYWLIDLKKKNWWVFFIRPAGVNPLLAYILPFIVYALIGLFEITYLKDNFGHGSIGIVRSVVFTLIMVGFTNMLTKLRIRLHL